MKLFIRITFFIACIAFINIGFAQNGTDSLTGKAIATYDRVIKENRLAGNFPPEDDGTTSLPLGISKTIAGTNYIIAVDDAHFYPDRATCSAFMIMELPGTMNRIAFAATNITVNPKGVMPSNNTRLVLISEQRIKISPNVLLTLPANGSNYIEWDCNGFKSVNLKGIFEFSNSLLIPDPATSPDAHVTGAFELHTDDIHNFVTAVSITPFTLRGLKGLSFSVTDAVVDLSEISNFPSMAFPQGYELNGSDVNQWKGFYLRNLTITLPPELAKKNQARSTLFASNMLIDNTGLSGTIGATNVLTLGDGGMGSWQFSVDKIYAILLQNHLNGGGMAGTIKVPLFENNALAYDAGFRENTATNELDYKFIISPVNNLQATVLSASVDLYPTSRFEITKTNGKFYPLADLTGRIQFNAKAAGTAKLDFQEVVITSEKPYIQSGTFNYTGAKSNENRIGKFPISISQIGITINQTAPFVYVKAGANMMQEEDKGFAAEIGFQVITKFENTESSQYPKWKFDRIAVKDVYLDISTQVYTLKGGIQFFEGDPIYGNGFKGGLLLGLKKPEFSASISAMFGSKDDYKYFYVDGTAQFAPSIPVSSGVSLYRFMGGLYYHMKQPDGYEKNLYGPMFGNGQAPNYVPDKNIGIGIKAGVTVGTTGKEDVFNADVMMELQFNSKENGGGLSLIKFRGECYLMTSIQKRIGKSYTEVPIGGYVGIQYDFNNSILDVAAGVAVNLKKVTGQANFILHNDPKDWFVYLGVPSNRAIINVLDIATLRSYFMVGTQIEPMPDLPYQIMQAFGKPNNRDTDKLNKGQGFAFGAELNISAYKEFGFKYFSVYGGVNLLLAFDAMLNKFPPGFTCPNTGTDGMNGWYLRGQIGTYMDGKIGAKGRFLKRDFDLQLLYLSAAAMLYGEFADPTYVEGAVRVKCKVFKTLKVDFDFDFSQGTRCGI